MASQALAVFLGHYGIALGAKGVRPEIPLGLLMLAAVAPDVVDPLLTALRIQADLYTHSLPAMVAYALIFGGLARAARFDWLLCAWVSGVAASHVLTDYLTSRIMTWPGGPLFGLNLYSWPWADFTLEATVIACGWLLYRRSILLERRNSVIAFAIPAGLVGLELAVAAGHLAS